MGTQCMWYLDSKRDTYDQNLGNSEPTNSGQFLFFIKLYNILVMHNVDLVILAS